MSPTTTTTTRTPFLTPKFAIGAGVIYGTACYIGYTAIRNNQAEQEATTQFLVSENHGNTPNKKKCDCGTKNTTNFSFITNPLRNQQYDTVAATYDADIGKDESVMGMNVLRRALLYFHASGTVLELAAGTGRNIPYYPTDGTVDRVVMLDTSTKMLQHAHRKLQDLGGSTSHSKSQPQFACKIGDASHLAEFPDHCFETVVDTFGLCSYDDPVAVLREMKRVCSKNPGGKILLLEHGRSKSNTWLTQYLDNNAERHAKNWGCVWNRDLDQIIEDSGLVIDTLHTFHFGTTYYVVCRCPPPAAASASAAS